ncbi:DUF551 domain-containing protein [Enterobacter hormaechei]
MSTITKEFTKEQLIEKLQHRISVASGFPESEKAQMDLELARIALASLEAEAVGEVVLGEFDDCGCHPDARVACIAADGQADWENFKDGTRLYTAPPAPVSVPAAMNTDDDFDSAFEHGKAVGWNACRAAMLQSFGNSEQLNSPVIPDSWVACSERLPENKPGSYEYLVFEGLNNRVQHDYWNVPDAGDDCQFTPFWNHYGRYVTHWMPLPAAPQQEA